MTFQNKLSEHFALKFVVGPKDVSAPNFINPSHNLLWEGWVVRKKDGQTSSESDPESVTIINAGSITSTLACYMDPYKLNIPLSHK